MAGSIDSGEKDVYDDINITPMLDLAYVLMVIFIIMCTATVQGIKVNLPKARSSFIAPVDNSAALSLGISGVACQR